MFQKLNIINEKGLHARASAKLVETVEHYDATACISKDGLMAEGDSIMGLLMLAAARGAMLEVETRGPEADILARALKELIDGGFGEEV